MKLGFVTAILPDLSFKEVVDFASDSGYACIEVMCWPKGKAERRYAGVTHIDCAALTASEAERLANYCADKRVSVSGLGYYPNPLSPNADEAKVAVEQIHRVIDASRTMGIGVLNTFMGRDWKLSVDENWPKMVETWTPILEHARTARVKVGIENCPMLFSRDEWPGGKNLMTTPAIWRRAFSDIPSDHFGLNYDPSHFVLQRMAPASPLREFQSKLFHLHAKDVKIRRDRIDDVGVFATPLEWHQPRIPGYGEMDWGQFMGALTQTSYRGPVCIEVEDDTFGPALEGRQRALKVARNVLKPFFP